MSNQRKENIIFDLGGVIINLDMDHTFDKFSQLFGHDVRSQIIEDYPKYKFFQQYEVGAIGDDEFRNSLRKLAKSEVDDAQLDDAWNSMLGDLPGERIDWIEELVKEYNVVILSNTNSIHINRFNHIFGQSSKYNLPEDLFHKTYYSHEINDRKPNKSCFQYVLDDFGMIPGETIFYDDNLDNINTASDLGINAVLVERNLLRKDQLPNGEK